PLLENSLDIALAARARYDEHSLLLFAGHHFVGRHELGASWHERHIDAHADTALGGYLTRCAGESSGPEVLQRFHGVGLDQFQRGLEQQLFEKRIAYLDRRAFRVRPGPQLERREQRGARYSVAARVAPDEVHRAARPCAARLAKILRACETDAHRVDERVLGVARLERDVPGDIGDT